MTQYCPFHDDRHDRAAAEGSALCLACSERVWQELHWLADMYDHLFEALTHRLNVEKAEQVKVQGGKDPMVRGLDMNDDAAELRHEIRGVAYSGLAWLYQRNPEFAGDLKDPEQGIPPVLRFLARHLHWITSDLDPVRMGGWGSRVVEARQKAEALVTPEKAHRIEVHGQLCQYPVQHDDGHDRPCHARTHTYREDTTLIICDKNPAHTVSRETAIRQAVVARAQNHPTRRLFDAIANQLTPKGTA